MVKAYLRYEPAETVGVISSGTAISYSSDGSKIFTAALEAVKVWNSRTGDIFKALRPTVSTSRPPEVTQLALSPDGRQLAVGYSNGTMRLWDWESEFSEPPAAGHTSGVSSLRYSESGALLASGGQDTNVVVWDVTPVIPLYRLQGHSGQITDLAFLRDASVLVSCSKDGYIRAWTLNSQHCFQTLGGQHGEVWSMDVSPDGRRLVVGYAEPLLEVLEVIENEEEVTGSSTRALLESKGEVSRTLTDRTAQLRFSHDGRLLACLGAGKAVEVFRVREEAEAKQHMKRRVRRKRKKLAEAEKESGTVLANGHASPASELEERITAADKLVLLQVVRTKSKVKGLAISPRRPKNGEAQLALALSSNAVEMWQLGEEEATKQHAIDASGHRSGVRAAALSSDDSLLLTAAENSVKIWNARSLACIRHIDCNQGLCAMFAPGNRHAVVGTKEGSLDLIDVGSAERLQSVAAHKGAIWAATPLPDSSGLISGGADHEAKFWEWEVQEEEAEQGGTKRRTLGLKHTRTVTMSDDILALKVTPNGRLLTLALLDSTVQILFMDSLKLKGSLYGHKLPVLAMDISSDSSLLVTASADKNIKIWGLDFNDCHKSIFAHNDSVMQVSFVPNTHYIFTVGKDGLLKYWDADRWELLLELSGHHAEIWCLVVSSLGDMVITGSADRSIRSWERTDEPFFAEEEKENRIESLFEADQPNPHIQARKEEVDGPAEAKVGRPGLDTPASRDAMGALADALEGASIEVQRIKEHEAAQKDREKALPLPANPILLGLSPGEYVLRALGSIRSADLEQALLLLPFNYAIELLGYLCLWLERGLKVELSCRVAVLLVRLHHNQLVATPSVRPTLARVRDLLQAALRKKKDTLGFNLAAIRHLQRLRLEHRAGLP